MRNSKSPSIHSIYQNALPFYHDRADLFNLDVREAAFAKEFLDGLFDSKLSLQIDPDNLSAEKLRHIYFESKNYEKTAGSKTVGVGYPLLIDSFEGDLFVAPIFIWQLHLEPAQTKVDSWVVKFSENGHLFPNMQLMAYLKRKFDVDWSGRLNELSSGNQLNKSKLSEICKELVELLQLEEVTSENSLVATPGIDKIGGLTEKGTLHWSAVIGLYPPQNDSFSEVDLKPEDVFVSEKITREEPRLTFAFTPCDPEQKTAIELAENNTMSIVEGIDALGKTQTVLNLLINALVNGEKCLVVSERAQALKKTQDLLSKTGIHQFHFLLDDALNDKQTFLELLKVMAEGTEMSGVFDDKEFEKKRIEYINANKQLNRSYRAVKRKIFGKRNWTDLVGLYLESQEKEGKELLAADLDTSDFSFEKEEHDGLIKKITICRPSFEQVGTLSHPLTVLHHRFFNGGDIDDVLEKVQSLFGFHLQKGKELQRRYLNEVDNYAAELKKYYEGEYGILEKEVVSIGNKISAYSSELGDNFSKAGSGFSFGLLFSSKKKKVAKAQKEVAKDFSKLIKLHGENRLFEFEREPDKNGAHIAKLMDNLDRYREGLNRWKSNIGSLVQEETNRLNSKTAHPALDIKEQITELEFSLEQYIEELNEAGLFHKPFENKTLTIPQRQKYLDSMLDKLESVHLNLRDFPAFHQWQSNFVALSNLETKVMKALIKIKPKNWIAAFQSWYFFNILSRSENSDLQMEDSLIDKYNKAWHSLKQLVVKRIRSYWKERQHGSLKKLKRKNKKIYNKIFGKSNIEEVMQAPLSQFFSEGFEAISDFIPLLFVTPHVALNVIPDDVEYDFIIFEESNRFSVELATAIVRKGRRVAIFGSDDNNGNETSLLQYALESGVPSAQITNIYEAPTIKSLTAEGTGQLFHFANEFFVDALEGRFHEMESTNDTEAQHIIRLLNQVKQTPQRVYPTVGVVAFTVEQRDLISSYLLKLKQQNSAGSEKIRQLERNGLGVYFSEEIFGQQFDILILSCTFGAVNLKGELTKKLMFLNTAEGQSHLHLLINKPVQKFFIVHSLSEEVLDTMRAKKYEQGTWLLANFIQMAEAFTNGNEFLIEESLEAIGRKKQRSGHVSPFAIQLKEMLSSYFNVDRFDLSSHQADLLLPLTIRPEQEGQVNLCLVPDVFLADTEHTSGLWEFCRKEGLKELGYEYIPVLSVEWFKSVQLETRKLASKLIRIDNKGIPQKKKEEGLDMGIELGGEKDDLDEKA